MRMVSLAIALSALCAFLSPAAGFAGSNSMEDRTANRGVTGKVFYPSWIFTQPDHAEFLPLSSNQDPQHRHPAGSDGQEWDPAKWGGDWTPETAIRKFFAARIFERKYIRHGGIPVVELGPAFYKISDLDQRRTLKLLIDQTGIFNQGFDVVELLDWDTHARIGSYTPKGMFLY